jgi:hypothetical protein
MVSGFIEDFAYAYWMLKNDPDRADASGLKTYSALAKWCIQNKERVIQLA